MFPDKDWHGQGCEIQVFTEGEKQVTTSYLKLIWYGSD